MRFLGVDIGTSRMKAALTDIDGRPLDTASRNVTVQIPTEGACEIDMNELWSVFCALCRELQERNPDGWKEIGGIGATGQGDGLWPVDGAGEPVRNAILWNDTRTKGLRLPDLDSFSVRRSANLPFAGSFHLLLRWLKENERDNYHRTAAILHCKDWINFKLTGAVSCDYSDASLAVLNLFEKRYDVEILAAFGVCEGLRLLPAPVRSDAVIGGVSSQAAKESGLRAGIPVIAGALDVCAVASGVGAHEVGDVCTIIGTTLCSEVVARADQVDAAKGMVVCHIEQDKYMQVMPTLSGTSSLDWVKMMLFPDIPYQRLEAGLASVPLGSHGVLYHPYLYGERAPFRDPTARGGFYGLSAIHTRSDLMRAAYEGLALSLLDCYRALPPIQSPVKVCGGGASSDFLCQVMADCLGSPVFRPPVAQAGIMGIARSVRAALNIPETAGPEAPHGDGKGRSIVEFRPRDSLHEGYLRLYEQFMELQVGLKPFWRARAEHEPTASSEKR